VEPANASDRRAGEHLLSGLSPLFPRIETVVADAGHENRKLACRLLRDSGWKLQIVKKRTASVQDYRPYLDRRA
jgi:hypothetical protein